MEYSQVKHWTEPNGTLIALIPIEWQYRNTVVEPRNEVPPYSFELYEYAVGCFQLSCYPFHELIPGRIFHLEPNPHASTWKQTRMDSDKFDVFLYMGAIADQALIGKYIYKRELRGDPRIAEQLCLVDHVLKSIKVIPPQDRALATNLDKYDQFLGSLTASYDLLYAAIEAESYIEILVVTTNQIDAFLRLAIVLTMQLKTKSDQIDVKYLFQADEEKGILERRIFKEASELGIIDESLSTKLNGLYELRNKIIHRYIISSIKTRDIIPTVKHLLGIHEEVRLALRALEDRQIGEEFGIYGRGFQRVKEFDETEIKRAHSWANDKHLLERLNRRISEDKGTRICL